MSPLAEMVVLGECSLPPFNPPESLQMGTASMVLEVPTPFTLSDLLHDHELVPEGKEPVGDVGHDIVAAL